MSEYYISGMQGLGDSVFQRAVLRQLCERYDKVWLITSWPQLYHDLPVLCVRSDTMLRTQRKNADLHDDLYVPAPRHLTPVDLSYSSQMVRGTGSILAAMMFDHRCKVRLADYRLPIPEAWHAALRKKLRTKTTKPICVYRPLCERQEWQGNELRNPFPEQYAELFDSIRRHFYVVSVADLQFDKEWAISFDIDADLEFNHGQLSFEELAALYSRATLVFGALGFSLPLSQATETASIIVYGKGDCARSFYDSNRFAPACAVEPVKPCWCLDRSCNCSKLIDVPRGLAQIKKFLEVECSIGSQRETSIVTS